MSADDHGDPKNANAETSEDVTELLDAWSSGDQDALERLMPLVVDDLRRVARNYLARERQNHTLQPTALVNEVYLKLVGRRTVQFRNRAQFFAVLSQMMRRILVDHARGKAALCRGGDVTMVALEEAFGFPDHKDSELLALDLALSQLAELDERQSRIVEMRYFGGLTIEETAVALDLASTTVKREWRTARLWLYRALRDG